MAEAPTPPGKIIFELASPEKLILSRAVDMVVVPGSEGLFGVLPQHAPMIVTLKPGVIDVYEPQDKIVDSIFVAGGFAEVTGERCVVLAEKVIPLAQLDRGKIQTRLDELRQVEELALQTGDTTEGGILAEIALQQAMLSAIDSHGGGPAH